jgi:hypothetical protein
MLHDAFNAAALGLPEPKSDTPMKMLPVRCPPPVIRQSVLALRLSGSPHRNLVMDVYLYNESLQNDLGRIESSVTDPNDENKRTVVTTLGRFVIKNNLIIRGRLESKLSLYGHKVSEKKAVDA